MGNTLQRVNELKDAGEDFEWYPTTDEMIYAIFHNSGKEFDSVLDVGAGDGRVLVKLDQLCFNEVTKNGEDYERASMFKKYAIEKSSVHLLNMPADIAVVGTDFMYNTLIDKKTDIVFCNPPYSHFESWAVKVIKESNCKDIFLILPSRWTDSKQIKEAIKSRDAIDRVIWSGDFMGADRSARARVDVIKIKVHSERNRYDQEKHDPFNVWFDEYFGDFDKLGSKSDDEELDEEDAPLHNELLPGQNLIEYLCELYTADMMKLLQNYKALSKLDKELLVELGVKKHEICQALKQRIDGLKHKYWKELFDNLDKITSRLTNASRKSMLQKLRESCSVDFSVDNAYAVVLWAIKNANEYIDQQLVDVFKTLTKPEHIKNYKSNQKTWKLEGWRYGSRVVGHTHYSLDYRIITEQYQAIKKPDSYCGFTGELHDDCHGVIQDIMTIANNLGFAHEDGTYSRNWASGKKENFYSNAGDILLEVKAFKNGNLHMKFRQDFIKALNIEASRLLGWIKSPEQAAEEMGIDLAFVKARYNSNLLFTAADGQKLLGS